MVMAYRNWSLIVCTHLSSDDLGHERLSGAFWTGLHNKCKAAVAANPFIRCVSLVIIMSYSYTQARASSTWGSYGIAA